MEQNIMVSSPPITVLMPVYNSSIYLKKAIKSILTQTFTNFEFLIINDGSTDNSKKIIKLFKDPRIKFIDNRVNKGIITRLNQGLKKARGKYIARMDADDVSYSSRLEIQYDFMEKNQDVAAVGSWVEVIDKKGRQLKIWRYESSSNLIKWKNLFKCPLAHPTAFFKKNVVLELGGYRPKALYYEDHDLWSRILENHKLSNIDKILLKYRLHTDSISKYHSFQQKKNAAQLLLKNINFYLPMTLKEIMFIKQPLKLSLNFLFILYKKKALEKKLMNAFFVKEKLSKTEQIKIKKGLLHLSFFPVLKNILKLLQTAAINLFG